MAFRNSIKIKWKNCEVKNYLGVIVRVLIEYNKGGRAWKNKKTRLNNRKEEE